MFFTTKTLVKIKNGNGNLNKNGTTDTPPPPPNIPSQLKPLQLLETKGKRKELLQREQIEKRVVAEGSQREREKSCCRGVRGREKSCCRGVREREELLQRGQRSGVWGEMLAGPARHILIRAVLKRDRSMVSHKGK